MLFVACCSNDAKRLTSIEYVKTGYGTEALVKFQVDAELFENYLHKEQVGATVSVPPEQLVLIVRICHKENQIDIYVDKDDPANVFMESRGNRNQLWRGFLCDLPSLNQQP